MRDSPPVGRLLLFATAGICSLGAAGCCRSPKVTQPTAPNENRAWVEEKQSDGSMTIGPFFLHKSESTEKGKLGVKVVDISPGGCRSLMAEYPDSASVILRFYEPARKNVLCELTLKNQSGNLINRPEACGGKIDLLAIGIIEINTQDNWVVFKLAR